MPDFEQLFRKYMSGAASAREKTELFDLIAQPGHNDDLLRLIDEVVADPGQELEVAPEKADEILSLIVQTQPVAPKRTAPIRTIVRWAAAAAVVAGMAIATWKTVAPAPSQRATALASTDISPAANGALLTLSNGKTVLLDSLQQGPVAKGITLQKGTVTYAGAETGYNTLSTPRGRVFHVVLPDGSQVWLNAGSTLQYPTQFTNERAVSLNGEAYFEVAQNAQLPFTVKTGDRSAVRVLGTSFNINAYDNEPVIQTTLLTGSVQVQAGSTSNILRPGEQASISPAATIRIIKADTSQVMAGETASSISTMQISPPL
ncbi:FecR domain-containing protein [Chitinophaga sedimenti]|uniref:FecR family protein n=1 Tax=Chitinophaga sedimenti TaxID=2033606 RepID=UPI002003236B|nr:FecR domain-containing protein [Chitinophaga sedimenti]MCK7556770.1 FecR domain-containing protein [Chitinophaga sedimenti]